MRSPVQWMKDREARKRQEAEFEFRQQIRGMKRQSKALDKQKNEMIRSAQRAKARGMTKMYVTLRNNIKTVMKQQNMVETMEMQFQIMVQQNKMNATSVDFMKSVGKLGQELSRLSNSASFLKNQREFEMGIMAMEQSQDELKDMMEQIEDWNSDVAMDSDLSDEELDRLIAESYTDSSADVDVEIDKRLDEIQKQMKLEDDEQQRK